MSNVSQYVLLTFLSFAFADIHEKVAIKIWWPLLSSLKNSNIVCLLYFVLFWSRLLQVIKNWRYRVDYRMKCELWLSARSAWPGCISAVINDSAKDGCTTRRVRNEKYQAASWFGGEHARLTSCHYARAGKRRAQIPLADEREKWNLCTSSLLSLTLFH
jgi:hypothetical protein